MLINKGLSTLLSPWVQVERSTPFLPFKWGVVGVYSFRQALLRLNFDKPTTQNLSPKAHSIAPCAIS